MVRQAAEVSAAGGHHLCLTGPPGAPIPAIAAAVAALMPPLAGEDMVEVTAIHSAAGLLGPGHAVITRPPFRAPHHTITPAAMPGGGQEMRPGEAALAHRGVLFLADAPSSPVPCWGCCASRCATARSSSPGMAGSCGSRLRSPSLPAWPPARAAPWPAAVAARRKLAATEAGSAANWATASTCGSTSPRLSPPETGPEPHRQAAHVSAGRVAAARHRTRHRLAGTPWRLNGDIPAVELRRSYLPPPEAMAVVHRAVELGRISAQAAHRVLRVAWTLADLEGLDHPGQNECSQALALHLGGIR